MENQNKVSKNNNRPAPIDLLNLLFYMLKRSYLIVIAAVIGAVIFGYRTYSETKPMYKSTAMMFVAKVGTITSINDIKLSSNLIDDYIVITKSKPVIDSAIQSLYEMDGVMLTREEARGAISVREMNNTHILEFSVTYSDPEIASDLCNVLVDVMADQIAFLMCTDKPSIVEYAEPELIPVNTTAVSDKATKGALYGAAICIVILMFVYILDDKIKDATDTEKSLDVPVLVSIPYDRSLGFKKNTKKAAG